MLHISISAEPIFQIFGFTVTNALLTSWLVMLLLIGIALFLSARIKRSDKIPGKFQNLMEFAIEKLIDFLETVAGSRSAVIKFFPVVATIFLFILLSNWLGVLPGVGGLGFYHLEDGKQVFVPLFRSVNSDINMTLALALIVVTMSHVVGFITIGLKNHLKKFFRLTGPIDFFTGLLEIISEFGKIISLTFRLFGNVFAGEILLTIMVFLVPYLIPVPFLALEIFVGFIQALIFAVLAMMFLAQATEAHH